VTSIGKGGEQEVQGFLEKKEDTHDSHRTRSRGGGWLVKGKGFGGGGLGLWSSMGIEKKQSRRGGIYKK